MVKLILLFFVMILNSGAFAQNLSSIDLEKKVVYYERLNNEDSLIYYYQMAKSKNLISTKLPVMVGDFYFNKKQYAKAITYYEYALNNDWFNTNLHYKAYVCYGNLGMTDQQRNLTNYFLKSELESYKIKKSGLENISFFSGMLISNIYKKTNKLDLNGSGNTYGSIDRTGNLNFMYASVQYKMNSRFSLMASFNQNNISGNQQFQYKGDSIGKIEPPNQKPITIYSQKDVSFKYSVSQPILFTQVSYILNTIFKFKLSYALTKTNYTLIQSDPKNIIENKFISNTSNNTESTLGFITEYRKPSYNIAARFFVMPFSNKNYIPLIMKSDSDRTQFDLAFTYYPFQTYKLSIKAQASLLNTQNSYQKYVFNYDVNWNAYKNVWFNLSFIHNNLKNYIDMEGAVVYNIDDIIKNKLALKLIYYNGKNLEFSLQVGMLNRTGKYSYIQREGTPILYNKTSYKNLLINGGIKWNL